MSLWQQQALKDPLIQLVNLVGFEKAGLKMGKSEHEVKREVAKVRYRYDSIAFAEEQLKIMNKDGELVPLKYNFGQRKIWEAKERQLLAGKPVRICLLKARQFGGTTQEEADVFRECILRDGRSAMIIAHDLDSARHIREMNKRYFDYYDLPKPRMKKETDKWWKFEHRRNGKNLDSHLRIDTAEELSTGHSLTLHHLHLSEIQLWRNATELVKGLFPTVPNSPDTSIFMEGTGSGVGDYWYDFCQMAMNPDSGWEFVFVAWYEIEDYTRKFDSEEKKANFEAKLDEEEKILFKQGITLEQLNWRRATVQDFYKGDLDAFKQQYPATPDESFLTSGRPVFNSKKVLAGMFKAEAPTKRGNFVRDGIESVKFVDDPKGLWELWEEEPVNFENAYCGGFDVAEGKEVVPELGNRGADVSVGKIKNRMTKKNVAVIPAQHDIQPSQRVRLAPDLYAEEIAKASLYWKRLGCLVENNAGGSGNVVIHILKNFPNINLIKTVTVDKVHDTRKEEYGWHTKGDTKRLMIDTLAELIREEELVDPSKNFWSEASTFIYDKDGKTKAQGRKFDYEVIASALVEQADDIMPMVFRPIKEDKQIYWDKGLDIQAVKKKTYSQAEAMEKNYCNV